MLARFAAALGLLCLPGLALAQTSEEDWEVCPKIENEQAAIEACTRIIERKGEGRERTGIAYSNRCGARGRLGQDDQGLFDCNNAIRLLPNYSMAYNNRGNRYRAKGEGEKALADYNKAIQLDAKNAFAFNNRGLVYEDRKDYELALTDYNRAIELDPTYFTAYLNRGDVLRARGDYERAVADYQKAVIINPRDAGAQDSLGSAMTVLGRYDLALRHTTSALELNPRARQPYFARGMTNLFLADYANAASDLRKAVELNVIDHAVIYGHIARVRGGDPSTTELEAGLRKLKPGQWPYQAAEFLLGRRPLDSVRSATRNASENCEANFIIAQWHLIKDERQEAVAALRTASEFCPNGDYERMGSREELRRLGN